LAYDKRYTAYSSYQHDKGVKHPLKRRVCSIIVSVFILSL